jgi:predicted transcriptional regulator
MRQESGAGQTPTEVSSIDRIAAMEVHLPQDQETRDTDDLVQEAVARLLAHNEWFKRQVQVGLDQIARGEFGNEEKDEEEMDARVERMLQR